MRIFLYLLISYIVVVVITYLLQRSMLYFPDPQKPSESQLQAMGLQFWPPNPTSFRGLIASSELSHAKGTVVVFHGNAGAAQHRSYYVQALERLGYRVVLAEYPGFGGRSGKINETNLVADARETVQRVYENFGGPLFILGESLGSGVAAWVAADPPVPLEAVILLTPWDRLPDLAQTLYWYLPARWLLDEQYDNIQNLQSFKGPVAVLIAGQDEVIPNRHSMRLYDALPGPKKLWMFEGAGHNSWPTAATEDWWHQVMTFVDPKK